MYRKEICYPPKQSTKLTNLLVDFTHQTPETRRKQASSMILDRDNNLLDFGGSKRRVKRQNRNRRPRERRSLPIERGDDDATPERHGAPREDLDGNRAANHLLYVGADERELRHGPERARGPGRVLLAAELGEVLPRGHAEPRGEQLHQRAHDRRPHEQP